MSKVASELSDGYGALSTSVNIVFGNKLSCPRLTEKE